MSAATTYGKQAFGTLLNFDWSELGDHYEVRDDGIWVVPPSGNEARLMTPTVRAFRLAHPTGNLDEPALPFPFTVGQFRAFCESRPLFTDDYIDAIYVNDDKSLDEQALDELAAVNAPAAELVRALLAAVGKPQGNQPKLTAAQQEEVSKRLARSEPTARLAEEFGVSRRTIDKYKPAPNAEPKKHKAKNWISSVVKHK